jgi:hypothetical protein
MGFFETWVLHLRLIFRLNFVIPKLIFTSTNWNFGASLQYLHSYLFLPTRILVFRYNTYTHTCLYQLEFWGFVAILTLLLASTNLNFGASLQYLHSYLPLPTRILGLRCNTYTHTCLYQLEFWGFIAIPTLLLASTN